MRDAQRVMCHARFETSDAGGQLCMRSTRGWRAVLGRSNQLPVPCTPDRARTLSFERREARRPRPLVLLSPHAGARTPSPVPMSPILAELLGTAILVILGDGVVANVVLQRSKGNDSGWIVITTGWALAVTLAVYSVGSVSGAHLNPAVTIGLATIGTFPWANVPGYVAAQVAGGFVGAIVVWLAYLPHWGATADPDAKRAVFCTAPAIRSPG